MYGKFSYMDIKRIINNTSKKHNNKTEADFYRARKVGYYHHSNTNWVYDVYIVMKNELSYMDIMVFLFGHVMAKGDF